MKNDIIKHRQKGFRAEHYLRKKLEERGYYVIRSAGSHTAFDLIAGRHGHAVGIQVKHGNAISRQEAEKVYVAAQHMGFKPVIALFNKESRRWVFYELKLEENRLFLIQTTL